MSTKKDKGKLLGKQSAREKMRFDSTSVNNYVEKEKQQKQAKLRHKLRPKQLNVKLAQIYPSK